MNDRPFNMIFLIIARLPSKSKTSLTKVFDGSIIFLLFGWACSAAGSALHSHCRGREFESPQVHQKTAIFARRLPILLIHYSLCMTVIGLKI